MKKLKLIRQATDAECGLCCISMIASWYGLVEPISYYRKKFNVGRDGISADKLYLILEEINITTKIYKVDDLNAFEFENKPYILFTSENHFIVVMIKSNKEDVLVYDPSKGKTQISIQKLQTVLTPKSWTNNY